MNRNIIIFIGVIIAAILVTFTFRTKDIREEVSKTEKIILSVLGKYGIAEKDVTFREENEWDKSGIYGKTVKYIFIAEAMPKISQLPNRLRSNLKEKHTKLNKISYHAEGDGSGIIEFDITYKKQPIISVIIKKIPKKHVEKKKGKIAIILDDFGYTKKNFKILKEINEPLTLAVLPDTPYAQDVCSFAKDNGFEVILHLPMEPKEETEFLEKGTIMIGMDEEAVKNNIASMFNSVYTAIGVSNHMGSKATENTRIMELVMKDLKKRNKFFLDSLTTGNSVAEVLAVKEGVPYAKRDIFIDNKSDKEYIKNQIAKLEKKALSEGSAIAIGHDRTLTIETLKEVIPAIEKRNIEIVSLSEMMEKK